MIIPHTSYRKRNKLMEPGQSGVWEPLPDCCVARVRNLHDPKNDPPLKGGHVDLNGFVLGDRI